MKRNLLYLLVCLMAFCNTTFAQTSSPDCSSEVAGIPVPPASLIAAPTSGAATIPASTTTSPNYGFIITDADHLIVGLSNDGVFNFTGLPFGTYGFTGIAYNNTELATVQQLVCALPSATISSAFNITVEKADSIKAYLCDNTPATLIKLFGLLDLLSDQPQNIDSVVVQLNGIVASPLVNICYAVTPIPTYSITYGTISISNVALQNVIVSPTLIDDRIAISTQFNKPQTVTLSLYDVTGRLVKNEVINSANTNFDHTLYMDTAVPKGLLLLHIQTEEGVYTAKLMKK